MTTQAPLVPAQHHISVVRYSLWCLLTIFPTSSSTTASLTALSSRPTTTIQVYNHLWSHLNTIHVTQSYPHWLPSCPQQLCPTCCHFRRGSAAGDSPDCHLVVIICIITCRHQTPSHLTYMQRLSGILYQSIYRVMSVSRTTSFIQTKMVKFPSTVQMALLIRTTVVRLGRLLATTQLWISPNLMTVFSKVLQRSLWQKVLLSGLYLRHQFARTRSPPSLHTVKCTLACYISRAATKTPRHESGHYEISLHCQQARQLYDFHSNCQLPSEGHQSSYRPTFGLLNTCSHPFIQTTQQPSQTISLS